eukprot:CAMPEP_0170612392 /NCGR_PEP_ID=MMETSP0224-20130122/23700_1 /TAXON_ID=285029 /ORGANISM="Togula jolla, Strain CCCM 725" /LENGTH=64 /DNA_ID=CAMNT_0010937895 /DNA_START=189 /DNA_END=383 /DNA_ORIENTATION=-
MDDGASGASSGAPSRTHLRHSGNPLNDAALTYISFARGSAGAKTRDIARWPPTSANAQSRCERT